MAGEPGAYARALAALRDDYVLVGWSAWRRNSKLPIAGAIVANPLVLADEILLAPEGLDRERRVVFKIEPALRDLLPKPEDCTSNAVTRAMHFLLDE